MKILENIRVLDLTNVLAGPFATLQLALMGAEVIKIENPQGGDLARKLGNVPEYSKMGMGTSFLAQNSNKKSMTLNLKTEEGKEIFRKLLKTADVVVENFKAGVMEKLGFPYQKMYEINPKIIYCAISGFGQTGPLADRPAYDQIIQGMSGVMAVNGDERLNPLRCGFPICDTVGGLTAAFAIVSALFHRERTGEGQFIDVALLDSIMPLLGWTASNLMIGGQDPIPMGNENFTAAPSGTFKTKDGYINIAANEQKQWEALADTLGLSELKTDPRFQDREARKKNRYILKDIIEQKLIENTTDYWVNVLIEKDVPCGEILSLREALNSPQLKHRGTIGEIEVEGIGKVKLFNLPPKFSKVECKIETPPPKFSQHTSEILKELGYTDDEIRNFKEKGVI